MTNNFFIINSFHAQGNWTKMCEAQHNDMKKILNVIALANNEYRFPVLNEEYEKLAERYYKKEITCEEFFEEYEQIKMVIKLVEE